MKIKFPTLKGKSTALAVLGSLWLFGSPAALAQARFMSGHVPPAVTRLHLQSQGGLPAAKRLDLEIGLPLRNRQELDDLLRTIYDPASPNYHHYLTSEEFAARFGPTESDYRAVIDFVQSQGLTVTGTHPNRTLVDVSGAVANINRAFHTRLCVYPHPRETRTFYAPETEPSMATAVPILHITGLDDFTIPRPLNSGVVPLDQWNSSPASGSGPAGLYVGSDFRTAYAPNVTLTGAGQIVGLLQFDGYYENDILSYEAITGLPNVPLTNVLVGGYDGSAGVNNVEVALDIEMSISMAPGLSKVMVYEASNSLTGAILALNQMAVDNQAKQLSSSWGIENDPNFDVAYLQFAAQGQTFFQASGDHGAYYPGIDQWADDTNITLVGGTTLTMGGGVTQLSTYLAGHTATLLANGQVLVAGGYGDAGYTSMAEVYDPVAVAWNDTGSMNNTRAFGFTATLLTSGQVLVVGGWSNGTLAGAELYDPVTGAWTPTAPLNVPRAYHTATLLANGQVLVAGGMNNNFQTYLASSEIYDPGSGTWTMTGSLAYPHEQHTATLLTNGLVLVAGGIYLGESLPIAELYDPSSGTWTQTGRLVYGRMYHAATLLTNGQVLVVGGVNNAGSGGAVCLPYAEVYNPGTGKWISTGSMNTPRAYPTLTLLTNGQALTTGGYLYPGNTIFSSAEVYDPGTRSWALTGSMSSKRYMDTATLLNSGEVLVAGGFYDVAGLRVASTELYSPVTGTWRLTGSPCGPWLAEMVWNWGLVRIGFSTNYVNFATGGGISANFAIPDWQLGLDMTTNQGSLTMRNVPDVAMTADNVFVTANNGQGGGVGGTSAAAPLWAGFTALVNQQAAAACRPTVGFINPAIYAIGRSASYTADFHDIVTGNSTNSGSPNLYDACPGYDLCTGWGTPVGQHLIDDLAPPNLPPAISITTPANGTVFLPPATFTVNATASDSDGTVAAVSFYRDGQAVGNPIFTPPYSIRLTNVAVGTHQLTARATDNCGATTGSAPVTIRVDAPPTASITSPANGGVILLSALGAYTNVMINAAAADSDGAVARVDFYVSYWYTYGNTFTLAGSSTTAPYSWNLSNVGNTYGVTDKLKVVAWDNDGCATTSSVVSIYVDVPLGVSITSPANGSVFPASTNITISTDVANYGGTPARVDLYQGTQYLGQASQVPIWPPRGYYTTWTYTWTNVPGGAYSLQAVGTDLLGVTNASAPVQITVQ